MAAKKGLCPVGFFWQGEGIGGILMRSSLLSAFFGLFLFLLFKFILFLNVSFKEYFFFVGTLWICGKAWLMFDLFRERRKKVQPVVPKNLANRA